jgi:NitT/TauT family transport system ATP-binding protein
LAAGVELSHVTVVFEQHGGVNRVILHDLSLSVPPGQFVAIVGLSGSGKTTILNLLAGLVQPTLGTVDVMGRTPIKARDELGFMLARDALLPWRTARGNVEYGLELRGIDRKQRRRLSERWLEAVGLSAAGDLWPWQLSQGMRQRVALARTWALDPALLLMDEPFAALDANTRVTVQEEFLRLWQGEAHRTVVFVTHDLSEAVLLADRVVLVAEGAIRADRTVPFERPRDPVLLGADPAFRALQAELRELIT